MRAKSHLEGALGGALGGLGGALGNFACVKLLEMWFLHGLGVFFGGLLNREVLLENCWFCV